MSDKDGGPAFPQSYRVPGSSTIVGPTGITLWDYYAAAAMSALASEACASFESRAIEAADNADAMLAERKKRGIGQ